MSLDPSRVGTHVSGALESWKDDLNGPVSDRMSKYSESYTIEFNV